MKFFKMYDCLFNKFKKPVSAVYLVYHKQFIDFYSIVKSFRPKPNICISQTLIVCYF